MKKNKSRYLLFFFLIVFLFILSSDFCLAQRQFEVEYPPLTIPGTPELKETTPPQELLPQYLKYIFNFGVAAGIIMAFVFLIIGGFLYILSPAVPEAKKEAKERIFASLSGMILLLLIYIIITTINPQLRIFGVPELESVPEAPPPPTQPGIYLYGKENCGGEILSSLTQSVSDLGDLAHQIKSFRIVNDPSISYGVVLFSEVNYRGSGLDTIDGGCHNSSPPNSIIVFRHLPASSGGVTFYRKAFYNEEGGFFEVKNTDIGKVYRKDFWILQLFVGWMFVGAPEFEGVPEEEKDCVKWDLEGNCLERKPSTLAEESISSIKINGYYVVKLNSWWPSGLLFGLNSQVFPTPYDVNKEGPKQIKWEHIRGLTLTGQRPLLASLVIYPGEIYYPSLPKK